LVNLNVIGHQINGKTNKLGGYNLEDVGDDNEYRSKNKMPFILEEIFIKVLEFFH
jgi:hypothetical protein